jgi:hypothetical protein
MAASGHLTGQGDSGLSYYGIDEISGNHLTEIEKSQNVNLIIQNNFINLYAIANVFLLVL